MSKSTKRTYPSYKDENLINASEIKNSKHKKNEEIKLLCVDTLISPDDYALFINLESIMFRNGFNQLVSNMPNTLISIDFGDKFNQPLTPDMFPPLLTSITFGDDFNQPIPPNIFPASLEGLTFRKSFNQPLIKGSLPENLEWISLGGFNQPLLKDTLPPNLKMLLLSGFNQPLTKDSLPKKLEDISFWGPYNHPISKGVFPDSLLKIHFNDEFNQPLIEDIPMEQNTENKSWLSGIPYPKRINECWIPSLAQGFFQSWKKQKLQTIEIKQPDLTQDMSNKRILPPNLKELQLGSNFDQPLYIGYPAQVDSSRIGCLPPTLVHLRFNGCYKYPLVEGVLPQTLESINISHGFNHPVNNRILPSGLRQLNLGNEYNQPIEEDTFPKNLTKLKFDIHFNQPLKRGTLPSTLKILSFSVCFNQSLDIGVLPHGLTHLKIMNNDYDKPIFKDALPDTLVQFNISEKYKYSLLDAIPASLDICENNNGYYTYKNSKVKYDPFIWY
jgi:hypothetical protein